MNIRRTAPRASVLAILLLAGTGGWISGELVKLHADLWAGGGAGNGIFGQVCKSAESAGLPCGPAAKSGWSQFSIPIPLPSLNLSIGVHRIVVPTAFVGLAYFLFLAVWFAVVGVPRRSIERWQLTPLAVAYGGGVLSVLFLVVMLLGVAPACVWCIAAHLVNIALVGFIRRTYRGFPRRRSSFLEPDSDPKSVERTKTTVMVPAARLGVLAVCFALVLISGLWVHRREQLGLGRQVRNLVPYRNQIRSLRNDPDFLLREHSAQPRQRVPGRAYPEPSANQHHLVVFTDFECPACSCEAKRLRQQIVPLFDGTLAVSIRHYPLNDECNDDATGTAHPQACGAAYAAEAARHLGGEDAFWAMHDLLFAHRRELGPATYSSLAERLGLDVERFRQTVSSGDVRSIVREDVALATRLGVSATPALFLDGRRVTDLGRDNLVFWKAVADKWKASARDRRMAATNPKRK